MEGLTEDERIAVQVLQSYLPRSELIEYKEKRKAKDKRYSELLLAEAYAARRQNNNHTARVLFTVASEYNNARALFEIGMAAYWGGMNIVQNEALAVRAIKRAAQLGSGPAMAILSGKGGLARDGKIIQFWHDRALQTDDPLGKGLAYMYGPTSDQPKAVEHMKMAADAGDAMAQYYYGSFCIMGYRGMEKNSEIGDEYVSRSAAAGFTLAQKAVENRNKRRKLN